MSIWPFSRTPKTEQKSLAEPSDELLALFGLVPTTSGGVAVTADAALQVPAVSAAIRIISEAAACLDVAVKIRGEDDTEVPDASHAALPFLRDDANGWTSGYELIRDLVIDALSNDRGGMAWVNRADDGRILEVIRFRNGVLSVDFDQTTGEPSYRINNIPASAANVIHLRSPFGKAPLTLAREALGMAIALNNHGAKLFTRGARPGGVLKFPKGMGEESVRKARAAWRATHEDGDGAGRTAILYDGAEFEALTFNSTDAQFIENRKFQILEIARAFRVPPTMLFDLERATWSNGEQQGMEFLTYCLEPWLKALEGALRRALLLDDERPTHVIRFDRDDLTRADLGTRATAINSLIASRVLNPNEARVWLGMEPYAGGSEFTNPNITTQKPAGPAVPAPPAQQEVTPNGSV